jgi:hypothetical protein
VANEQQHVNQVLDQGLNVIRSMPTVDLVKFQIEFL